MIDVADLRALRLVASLGTVAQAADELGFTASAVSQRIKRLERQLGVALLAPAGRRVVLTAAGQGMVDTAPEVFQALERCIQGARSVSRGAPRGTLRVMGFSTAIRGLLAPAMARLSARWPDVQLRVTERDPAFAAQSLDAGTADVALIHDVDGVSTHLPSSLARRLIHTDHGDVVMSRDHQLAGLDRPLISSDLVGNAWVSSPADSVCHRWFLRVVADLPEEPDVRHLVDDFATQLSLVSAGGCLALMPRLSRPAMCDRVVSKPLQRKPTRHVYAAWRRSTEASPALQALLEELGGEASADGAVQRPAQLAPEQTCSTPDASAASSTGSRDPK